MPEDNRSGAKRMEESEMAMLKNVKRATGGHLQKPKALWRRCFYVALPSFIGF